MYQLSRLLAGTALAVALAAPAHANGIIDFSATLSLDGGLPIVLPVVVNPLTGNGEILNHLMIDPLGGWQIQINELVLKPDPIISYDLSVIDFGAPTTFSFVFEQAIVPTSTPGQVRHENSSSTTDGGANGVPVTAEPPPGGIGVDGDGNAEIFVYSLSTNGGSTWLNADLDLRESFLGAAGGSDTQAALAEGFIVGPAGGGTYDRMRVDVNYSMGGGNDGFTWNGEAEVVPEPGTALLLAFGLAGLAMARQRL